MIWTITWKKTLKSSGNQAAPSHLIAAKIRTKYLLYLKNFKQNPLFTSSEDIYGASQSIGQDMSVDSDAIQEYDYFEKVGK